MTQRPRRRPAWWAAAIAWAVAAGLAIGLAIGVLQAGSLEAWLAQRGAFVPIAPPYEARGRLIAVDGRDVYLDCRGSGSPTVVLEGGFGSGAAGWGRLLDDLAGVTRTCAWDRPGLGRSEPRGRHRVADTAADLRAALAEAGERGPFIVVAHSFGGVYARVMAEGPGAPPFDGDAADRVAALVMLDTYDPDLGMDADPALPEAVRRVIRENLDSTAAMLARGEDLDWDRSMADLAVAGAIDVPTIVLSGDPQRRYSGPPDEVRALIDAWSRAHATLCPACELEVVPGAGHFIHLERPDLVLARTMALVERVRADS